MKDRIECSTGEVVESYRKYLVTTHWREFRQRYISGWDGCCFVCGCRPKPVEIHHKTYDRIGNENLDDVVGLCQKCHSKVHKMKGKLSTAHIRLKTKDETGKGLDRLLEAFTAKDFRWITTRNKILMLKLMIEHMKVKLPGFSYRAYQTCGTRMIKALLKDEKKESRKRSKKARQLRRKAANGRL